MIIHPGWIGIDVSKAHFDIFDAESGRTERLPHTSEAARSPALTAGATGYGMPLISI